MLLLWYMIQLQQICSQIDHLWGVWEHSFSSLTPVYRNSELEIVQWSLACGIFIAIMTNIMSWSICRVNVSLGPKEERNLLTGLHTVADIFCTNCNSVLGWKYVSSNRLLLIICFLKDLLFFLTHSFTLSQELVWQLAIYWDHTCCLYPFSRMLVPELMRLNCLVILTSKSWINGSILQGSAIYFSIKTRNIGACFWGEGEVQGGEIHSGEGKSHEGQSSALHTFNCLSCVDLHGKKKLLLLFPCCMTAKFM